MSFASQQQEDGSWEEEVYLSFRYQGIIDEIVVAIAANGEFYLPLTELFELFAINYTLSPSSFSVYGYYLHEKNPYSLDFASFKAAINDENYTLDASDFLIKDVDFYVKPEVYEKIFGLNLTIDLSRLVLKLETRDVLPIISRYENRRAQERRQKYTQVSDNWYPLVVDRDARILNGGLVDYSLYSTVSKQSSNVNLSTSIGGELLFGDVQGVVSTSSNAYSTEVDVSGFRWRYVEDRGPWFTRTSIGVLNSKGLNPRSIRGFNVSNEPILTRTSFDQYIIDGNTEPEAEIELYQDNRLVEVSKADDIGYYRFFVPLNYGISRFKIRIYTKQGHIEELDTQIDVPFSFLPPGEFRYHFNGGVLTNTDPLDPREKRLAQLVLAYGINNWLSSKSGIDYTSRENGDKPIFYNQLSGRLGGAMMINLDLVYGLYYKLTSYGHGSQTSSWNVDYTYFQQDGILNPLGYKHIMNGGVYFPIPKMTNPIIVRFDGNWKNFEDYEVLGYNLYLNNSFKGVRFRYGLREEHYRRQDGSTENGTAHFGVVYSIPRNPLYPAYLQGLYIRNDIYYGTSTGEFETLSFQLSKQLSKSLKLQLSIGNDFLAENAKFEVGVAWDAEKFRSVSSVEHANSSHTFAQSLRGSVALDRNNQEFLWDNRQQVGRAGASIRMYVDENGSDSFDEGEEILPGNAVSIKRATTRQVNKSGISRLTQLQPYRRYNFAINEAKISNPLLLPKYREFSVILDPNSFKPLDIPFYTTGIIDGRVDKIADGAFIPISGLRVHVRSDDGSYEATLRTFSDGSYYSMEIPPGSYELWVDDSQLEFLGMISKPEKLYFTVNASSEGDFVEGLNFILE